MMDGLLKWGTQMAYQEEISRSKPSAFLFLIDQSGSMSAPFGRPDKTGKIPSKAEVVADALNANLSELLNRCSREEGTRDYFEVGIIGYGQSPTAEFCWEGQLAGRQMVPLSDVKRFAAVQPVEEENVVRGKIEKEMIEYKVWVKPIAATAGTPMKSALQLARTILADWIQRHADSYPPIVINITDGEATDVEEGPDGDRQLVSAAQAIASLTNCNGSTVLLINCHISGLADAAVVFPSKPEEVPPNPTAQVLYQMSSVLPPQMNSVAAGVLERPLTAADPIRGMVFNGNAVMLVKFLDIGTRPLVQRVDAKPGS
jgi:hypothetical protein